MNSASPIPTIALLTDFGTTDVYVGTMKAVMARLCPAVRFIDITHAIQPQNIQQGAFTLYTCYRYFAPGTVFLTVVDPGVGGVRRPLAAQAGDYSFVGPDNGVLSYALAEHDDVLAVELSNPDYRLEAVSTTFHGRDIFAPAAAHLAAGVPLAEFGPVIEDYYRLPAPQLVIQGSIIEGEVIHVDHFGNIVTSIGEIRRSVSGGLYLIAPFGRGQQRQPVITLPSAVTIQLGTLKLARIHRTYSEVAPGAALALVGSSGFLEISINGGSAAQVFNIAIGDPVTLQIG
ncbi:MAG: SAM-dependent chlorinase/fluorinase [Chloroflexi bacterium]|nr:SAM-dependent chlorinase/fluorinase [Chloroflexota bacterium]